MTDFCAKLRLFQLFNCYHYYIVCRIGCYFHCILSNRYNSRCQRCCWCNCRSYSYNRNKSDTIIHFVSWRIYIDFSVRFYLVAIIWRINERPKFHSSSILCHPLIRWFLSFKFTERNKVSMMLHFIHYNITWKDCVEQGFTYIGYRMSNHQNTNIISIFDLQLTFFVLHRNP